MKTLRSLFFLTTALGAVSFGALASFADPIAIPATPAPGLDAAATPAVVTADDSWDTVKNYTYDQRGAFADGLNHMTARLDAAIVQLQAKRATLPQTSVKDWDFAMKELTDARSDLRFQVGELDKATPETWNDVKDKLAQAWQRTKDAFDKVRMSTTT